MHIPDPRRHLVRYYGWYSNVSSLSARADDFDDLVAVPGLTLLAFSKSTGRAPHFETVKTVGPGTRNFLVMTFAHVRHIFNRSIRNGEPSAWSLNVHLLRVGGRICVQILGSMIINRT